MKILNSMENYTYPSTYEIEEVLSKFSSSRFVKQFAKERGILMPNASKQMLAKELSTFFWDNSDIIEIHNEAYQKNYKNTLAGFIITSRDSDFDLINSFEGLLSRGETGDVIIDTPSLISKKGEPEVYRSRLEYNRKRLGRIEFLQDEPSEFEFYIKKQKDEWLVEVDSRRSKDPSIIKKFIDKNIRRRIDVVEIKDNLTTEETILFFDLLSKHGMQMPEWHFADVTQLSFKKDKIKKVFEDADDEEETTEASDDELQGIKRALLDGHNLRENSFVKRSEKSGYRFTAMTFEYSAIKTPIVIQIKAEFKGNPKVFEVSVVEHGIRKGKNEEIEPITLDKQKDLEYRSHFWNNAKDIYFDLTTEEKRK